MTNAHYEEQLALLHDALEARDAKIKELRETIRTLYRPREGDVNTLYLHMRVGKKVCGYALDLLQIRHGDEDRIIEGVAKKLWDTLKEDMWT